MPVGKGRARERTTLGWSVFRFWAVAHRTDWITKQLTHYHRRDYGGPMDTDRIGHLGASWELWARLVDAERELVHARERIAELTARIEGTK